MQSMTKLPGMDKIRDMCYAFVKRINRLMKGYSESRIIFDRYIAGSLKVKTRAKRTYTSIQDSMNTRSVPMKLPLQEYSTCH